MPLLCRLFITLALCLNTLPCVAEPTANTESISKAEVAALYEKTLHAIRRKDIKTIAGSLSDSIVISGNIIFDGHPVTFNLNKTQYIAQLTKNWSLVSNYSYKRSNQVITLNDAQAKVTADVSELITTQQKIISVISQETAILKKEDGKLVAVRIEVSGVGK